VTYAPIMGETAAASLERLGFIGLGNIGSGMCANLLTDGHQVTAFDIDQQRLDAQVGAGALAGSDASEVAAASDITFLSLPTPEIMAAVSEDWLRGAAPGSLLVDLTTNSPATVREVGRRVEAAGCHLVEAPLTGGAPGARNRQLVFIVGGDDEQVTRVAPLFDALGRGTFHLGALGAGNVGKLVNSLMAFTTMWVSLEGLALAASNDIDLRQLLQMVRTSGGANSYLERRVDEIGTRGRPAEFAIELAAKDAGLMLEVGRQSAVPLPVASAVHQMLVYAKAQGLGGHDISDLVEVMERVTGIPLVLGPVPDEQ
jgi:3-hydroxyisobutyrate dehydrogenase-like beta-hydroxyacid dehydrogenase